MTRVLAVSDLHVGHPGNREVVDLLRPTTPHDWLIVAGDVGERIEHIRGVLAELRARFAKVIWVPGNHELWTTARDPGPRRGEGRYRRLIAECRALGVLTPEDPYPVWEGPGGPVALVPMFLLYDYTFLPRGARTKADALELARARGTVAIDEQLLAHEPYDSREQWCRARVEHTRSRLDAMDPALPLVLINHFPLLREQTRMLWHAEFAPWCGTVLTADWHRTYPVRCVVYGHLHIRRTDHFDGVRFEEVSLGYPREWRRRGLPDPLLREILPGPSSSVVGARARRAVGGAVRAATALTRPAAARRGRTTP